MRRAAPLAGGLTMSLEPMLRREVLKRCAAGALALAAPSLGARVARARTASPERGGLRTPITADIARWLGELRYEELAANVVERAKRVTLDTLGCVLCAVDAEPVRSARRAVAPQGGKLESRIIRVGGKGV